MPDRVVTAEVASEDVSVPGMRLDRYVADVLGLFSRSQIKVRAFDASVNGRPVKPSYRLRPGDKITIRYSEPEPTAVTPEPVDLSILYEDDSVVVIDKPVGMVVHPAKGNYSGTLVQGVLWHMGARTGDIGPAGRPGVVHRLDKDTSGVIVTAKDSEAQAFLAGQFKARSATKRYLAVVKGRVAANRGVVEGFMARDPRNRKRFAMVSEGGKWSKTEYRVMARLDGYTFVSLVPKTGRTHQLRVHLRSLGHPILGDPVYARRDPRFPNAELMLHAYRLQIVLPPNGTECTFRAPLPDRFKKTLTELRPADKWPHGG